MDRSRFGERLLRFVLLVGYVGGSILVLCALVYLAIDGIREEWRASLALLHILGPLAVAICFATIQRRAGRVGTSRCVSRLTEVALRMVPVLFLLLAVVERWPSGFYALLRIAVCGSAFYLAMLALEPPKPFWLWLMGAIAVLFNPLVPFRLGRSNWRMIDLFAAILFGISLIAFRSKPKEPN